MLTFRGMSAAIQVNGKYLPCFHPEYDEETKTATCWIPSAAGKEYAVWWKQTDIAVETACRIYIEGSNTKAAGGFLAQGGETSRSAVSLSQGEERSFMFADITVTDDDDFIQQAGKWKAPGTIRLTVHRVIKSDYVRHRNWVQDAVTIQSQPMHERNKKSLAHVTQLGPIRTRMQPKARDSKPYTPSDVDPWVTLIFRYRPAAVLQAEELMPRPVNARVPKGAHANANESELELDVDETHQKGQILIIEEEERRIEAERAALSARKAALVGGLRVKKEETARLKPARMRTGEVIDLTLSPE